MTLTDICDAFVQRFPDPLKRIEPPAGTALHGLTVGVKDNFDIAGMITGAGNPEFAADRPPAARNAQVVDRFLDHGASIVGKTHMDELAYSLMGLNARYGVPENPAARDRVPGGSSSGSASATAAASVDIGLGTDTGGSVRLPASFCGLFGWRPTHGLLSHDGMVPLASSFDVPGFFTRDLHLMERLMSVFGSTEEGTAGLTFRTPADMWSLPFPDTAAAIRAALPDLGYAGEPILPEGGADACLQAFRIHQGYEIWRHFGAWITERQPAFGPGIGDRFKMASRITAAEFEAARLYRERLRAHLSDRIEENTILVYPTAPGPAPLLTTPQSELEPYRNRALSLMSLAGHAGLPQLSIPFGKVDGAPVGLSLVGRAGSDRLLARAAKAFI